MHLAYYLELLHRAQGNLAAAYREVAAAHQAEVDLFYTCHRLAGQADGQAATLAPYLDRYRREGPEEPEAHPSARFSGPRGAGVGMLRDLQELSLLVAECDTCWMMLDNAAQGARDSALLAEVRICHDQTRVQQAWLHTQLSQAAVQALVVA